MLGGGWKRRAPQAAVSVVLLAGASGCQIADDGTNLVAGKQAFVQKCGSCHILKRAGTTGVTGPDLDAAFAQSRRDGFGQSTFQGVVRQQIHHPAKSPQNDPVTGRELPLMPANLVKGETAEDVAAYVASAVAKPGEDAGLLADVGVKKSTKVADLTGGSDDIPADPNGQLAYLYAAATAKPGPLTIESTNKSQIDHNISIEGQGVDTKGPIVKNGGVSKISFDAKPGTYTFYCSVPGHREGGMVGKLTVK